MARGDLREFLAAFVRKPGRVGAIAPSSASLGRAMCAGLAPDTGECLVEFGPGTGPFTAQIREMLADPARYLGVEIEPRFVALLRERFPDLRIVEASAADADAHVTEGQRVRAVLCGLPFASLPSDAQDGILACLDRMLGPGAVFRTFQYVHAYPLPQARRFRRRMRALFGSHRIERTVLCNLPPAFVLHWQRGEA